MMRNIGPPTIFMTLSANDYHRQELAMTIQLCTEENVNLTSLPESVRHDPLMTQLILTESGVLFLNIF